MDQGRIDVHHHLSTPSYTRHLEEAGYRSTRPNQDEWTPESALELMDEVGIQAAVTSLSRPGTNLGDVPTARRVARESNEHAADIVRRWPSRFGSFAALTLPDVDGSITEAAYAIDELGADGVVLLSNSSGVYLGDPSLDPLMEMLDERSALLFVHPTHLPADDPRLAGALLDDVPAYLIDFLLDTTRAAVNMARHRIPSRFPNLKIILSHGGGFLPYAAGRITQLGPASAPTDDVTIDVLTAELQTYYFDVALSATAWTLPSLLAFADPERVLYGTDHPAVSAEVIHHFTTQLDAAVPADALEAINRRNALSLMPRFNQAG